MSGMLRRLWTWIGAQAGWMETVDIVAALDSDSDKINVTGVFPGGDPRSWAHFQQMKRVYGGASVALASRRVQG